jgi:hypothetical protein
MIKLSFCWTVPLRKNFTRSIHQGHPDGIYSMDEKFTEVENIVLQSLLSVEHGEDNG